MLACACACACTCTNTFLSLHLDNCKLSKKPNRGDPSALTSRADSSALTSSQGHVTSADSHSPRTNKQAVRDHRLGGGGVLVGSKRSRQQHTATPSRDQLLHTAPPTHNQQQGERRSQPLAQGRKTNSGVELFVAQSDRQSAAEMDCDTKVRRHQV